MAITNRNQLIREVYQLLNKEGFETSNIYEQSCFDIVARKKLLILLLKVLVNIDSINESHVEEIRQISNVFLASPIIVGVKSKNHILEEDVVYERHGLPAIGLETLKNIDAIGNDFKLSVGFCGKDGQTAPVGDGGPHTRILNALVGGMG